MMAPYPTPEQLLAAVETYLRRTGMAASRLGKLAANDPKLVFQLRIGRELRHKTALRLLNFMHNAASRRP